MDFNEAIKDYKQKVGPYFDISMYMESERVVVVKMQKGEFMLAARTDINKDGFAMKPVYDYVEVTDEEGETMFDEDGEVEMEYGIIGKVSMTLVDWLLEVHNKKANPAICRWLKDRYEKELEDK